MVKLQSKYKYRGSIMEIKEAVKEDKNSGYKQLLNEKKLFT